MNSGTFALVFAAAFAGAAFYVNWVEQPARMALDEEALLREWGPSDRRGVALLAGLALISALAGFLAYFEFAGSEMGDWRARHRLELALHILRHGAAQQSDPVAARPRRRRRARTGSPVGSRRIRSRGDRIGRGRHFFVGDLTGVDAGLSTRLRPRAGRRPDGGAA